MKKHGINAQFVLKGSVNTAEVIKRVPEMGLEVVRLDLHWPYLQQEKGKPYNFNSIDRIIEMWALQGVQVQPLLMDVPEYAKHKPGRKFSYPAQEHLSDWDDFVSAVVARYGASGVFWVGKSYKALPVDTWELWNEVDGSYWWDDDLANTPSTYAALYKRTRALIHKLNPNSTVMTAGLSGTPKGIGIETFYRKFFAAKPGPVDVVNVHCYAHKVEDNIKRIYDLRTVLQSIPDAKNLPIAVTEAGWDVPPANVEYTSGFTPPPPFEETRAVYTLRMLDEVGKSIVQYIHHTLVTEQNDPKDREKYMGIIDPKTGAMTKTSTAIKTALHAKPPVVTPPVVVKPPVTPPVVKPPVVTPPVVKPPVVTPPVVKPPVTPPTPPVVTPPSTPPPAPVDPGSVTLSMMLEWDALPGANSYEVVEWPIGKPEQKKSSSTTLTHWWAKKGYRYGVRANNSTKWSVELEWA